MQSALGNLCESAFFNHGQFPKWGMMLRDVTKEYSELGKISLPVLRGELRGSQVPQHTLIRKAKKKKKPSYSKFGKITIE
jgi:hypothetical protein